jgi:predicted MFS family arabinose efflux permease
MIANSRLWSFAPNRMTWIVGLGSTLGFASQTAGFWIVGAFVHSGRMDIQQASLLSTAEMVTMGVVTLALAPVIHRVPQKRAMILALFLALLTQGFSAVLPGFIPVLLTRIVSGMAFGVIYAMATALGAAAKDPQKAYAAAGTISLAIGTVWNLCVGYATEHYGHVGVFGALCLYCLVTGVPMVCMLFTSPTAQLGAYTKRIQGSRSAPSIPFLWLPIVGVMLVMGLFAIMTNGVYIFIEQIAEHVGISGTQLGFGLTISSLTSALGVAGLSRLGRRASESGDVAVGSVPRRTLPLTVSMLTVGVVSWIFMASHSAAQMYLSLTAWLIIYWAVYSYVLELAVIADPRGRVASAAGSILILLGGAGSAVAGFTAKNFGMQSFGLVACVGCTLGAVISIFASRSLSRRPWI